METGARFALGLGVGYFLGSTARMWLALVVRMAGAGSGRRVERGVLQFGALPELGIAEITSDEHELASGQPQKNDHPAVVAVAAVDTSDGRDLAPAGR